MPDINHSIAEASIRDLRKDRWTVVIVPYTTSSALNFKWLASAEMINSSRRAGTIIHTAFSSASPTPYTWAEKFESFERINSIRETNGNFDSCNSCKRLVPSRLHELHESEFPFVSRIEFIRSKVSNFSAHVYGITTGITPTSALRRATSAQDPTPHAADTSVIVCVNNCRLWWQPRCRTSVWTTPHTAHARIRLTHAYGSRTHTAHARIRLKHAYGSRTHMAHARIRLTQAYRPRTHTANAHRDQAKLRQPNALPTETPEPFR